MAKRRKLGAEAGLADCYYCGKDVPEDAWRCPHCRKWYRDGKEMVAAITVVSILVLSLVGFTVAQYVDFPGEDGGGGEPPASYSVEIWTHGQYETHNTGPDRSTSFMIFVRNKAQVPDTIDFTSPGAASGLHPHFDYPSRIINAGSLLLNILTVDVDSSVFPGTYSITVKATSRGDTDVSDSVDVSVQIMDLQPQEVEEGNYVRCDYILWLSDASVKDSGEELKVYTGTGEMDPQYQAEGYLTVIEGFRQGLLGMKITETKVILVPPSLGYPSGELAGQNLYFQITLVSVDG
ncbi:MAG: FKBP-type peptidyl-prolyl cis-trans isomerase [Thermoplasmata archaeon]|nr:FKBP-type peptidyl-prolyl cis-trans isomerase [Thermoplasmata archaeon]